jgi:predicted phosphoribosyltransferase
MLYARKQALFENRFDAGRKVAAMLVNTGDTGHGAGYSQRRSADRHLRGDGTRFGFRCGYIPQDTFPAEAEAGFGAIADTGTPIINEDVVKQYNLTDHQINYAVNQVRAEIRRRTNMYRPNRPLAVLKGRTVIITDDGLASGFTMKAAIESVRRRQPKEIIAAVPAASQEAMNRLEGVADKIYTCAIGTMPKFFIADFYNIWYDFTDKEVKQCLDQWRMRNLNSILNNPPNGKKENPV